MASKLGLKMKIEQKGAKPEHVKTNSKCNKTKKKILNE